MTDYARLYEMGRCKSIGVPWNEAEKQAVYILKIPADYVRRGCLTNEAHLAMIARDKGEVETTGRMPLSQLKKAQLYVLAQSRKLNVTMEATRETMIEELKSSGLGVSIEMSEIPKA